MTGRKELLIEDISCAHCAQGLEQHLKGLGLNDAIVNFNSKSASFTEKQNIPIAQIISSLEKIGFKAQLPTANSDKAGKRRSFSALELKTVFCCLLAAPLVFSKLLHSDLLHLPIIQLCLTTPIMLSGGIYFLKSALRSLRLRNPNMDVLIALGTWSSFFYSIAGTVLNLGSEFLFYETSASIVAIVLLGNLIEEKAVNRTENAVSDLQKLRPETIKIKSDSGSISEVVLDQLKVGDKIILVPGDRVPCDGRIADGFAEVDYSFLTGESLPKSFSSEELLSSGALVVGGQVTMIASHVGEDSSLLRIIRGIQESRAAKPELEKLADRITAVFVPVVLLIALSTFILNYLLGTDPGSSLLRAIAVLVISCPCALGLATPTAVTVALGLASKYGILVRKAWVFEAIPAVKHFFFDKTGTLTDGNFVIEKFDCAGLDPLSAKSIILAMEANSHHPIAKALRRHCSVGNIQPAGLIQNNEQRGLGVLAESADGKSYELSSKEVKAPYNLVLRQDGEIVVQIKLSDSAKDSAISLMKYLHQSGISSEILSGDKQEKTAELALGIGVDKFSAELLPDQKAERVAATGNSLQVAFVGDGINDSAALSRANVGITFAEASDLARHSADVVIISGGLEKIAQLIELSRKTTSSIRQNLFWAFFYNTLMIPIAALGLLSPMHAAFAMVFSDLIVVANSLRLKLWKPAKLSV